MDRLFCAKSLAKHLETEVYVTPDFATNKDDWRYKYFFKGVHKWGKQPDLKIGDAFWEIKSYERKFKFGKLSAMMQNIVRGEQSTNMIVRLNHEVNIENVKHSLLNRLNSSAKNKAYIRKISIVDKAGAIHEVL